MSAAPKPPSQEIIQRLAFLLYRAWTEARNVHEDTQRIFDLADVMHNVPALLVNCTEPWLEMQRQELRRYSANYPSTFDYVKYLDEGVPEPSDRLWLLEESDPPQAQSSS